MPPGSLTIEAVYPAGRPVPHHRRQAAIQDGSQRRTPSMGFDIDRYCSLATKLDAGDLDFSSFQDAPLPAEVLRCLRYMHDIENHTVCYLRDVLVTRAHKDPEVTTFLTFWNYEEYWHGEAIARVLAAHGEVAGRSRAEELRRRLPRRDAWRPLTFQLGSLLTPHLTAVHMTWGAINEWTTQAGYARLATLAGHPVLAELLHRIMRQEGRHIDFYLSQANRRLSASRSAQRLTRWALRRFWAPVGNSVMPDAEVRFLSSFLFGGHEGRAVAERIDRRVDRLPGLAGLGLLQRAAQVT
ncbi:MAG: ferritin-like domain-containing protein [Acidimicrobiales bacterium]